MAEKLRPSNGADPIPPDEDSPFVREAVESSAQSVKNFLALAQTAQEKIITGMISILCVVEKRYRGRLYANRAEIGALRLDTLATFRGNAKFDEDEGVGETEEAILLRQLAEGISKEFRIHPRDLFTPIGEVFKRSMTTMESGFQNYGDTKKYLRRSKETGELSPGNVRSTGGVSNTGNATSLKPYIQETDRRIF